MVDALITELVPAMGYGVISAGLTALFMVLCWLAICTIDRVVSTLSRLLFAFLSRRLR